MDKRVYGILGISSVMANWNADFSGYPKTTSDGTTFGSDKALKYPMKKMWEDEGRKVIYIKSMHLKNGNLIPRSLKERYEYVFKVKDLKKRNTNEVLTDLFKAIDIKNFGATFAESGKSFSITGAVQIGQGLNKYEDSQPQKQTILSPFGIPNSKDENGDDGDAKNTSLGTKIVSDEAHYFYPFVINPLAYKGFENMGITTATYTKEDYLLFKETALCAATSFATNAKVGCENEFALFVETKSDVYLPNLTTYITFSKGEDNNKNKIEISCLDIFKELKDDIISIEVYYNVLTTEKIVAIEGAKYFDIITKKEVL